MMTFNIYCMAAECDVLSKGYVVLPSFSVETLVRQH